MTASDMLQAALEYTATGLPVFPLYTAKGGACDCSKGEWCDSPGKHPRPSHGFKEASIDEAQIREWWEEYPEANIGVATGSGSGRIVLDVDGPEGAEALKGKHLPPTAVSHTGRGTHYWFKAPPGDLPSKVGILPKVDVRGDGGYVVAPPSLHYSGTRYRWNEQLTPRAVGFAPCPEWIVELVGGHNGAGLRRSPEERRRLVSDGVSEGERHSALCSLAGLVLASGLRTETATELLLAWNEARCRPPLPQDEAARIIADIAARERTKQMRKDDSDARYEERFVAGLSS